MAEGTIGGTPISELPESSFAYCEAGDGSVGERCHFPIRDKAGKADADHVRNALARLATSPFEAKARPKVEAAAKELGIGEPAGKALGEMKAEPMTTSQLDRWLGGQIPRRLLAVPFGGPIPSPKSSLGVDIDGEWFSSRTDLFDGHSALLGTRERLVDWHHVTSWGPGKDPVGNRMKGAVLGRIVMDQRPESDGLWVDFWANTGEQRLALVKALEERGTQLYGSSFAAYKKADPHTGEILVWPMTWETISSSPQNTYAVMPSLKAMLADPILADMPEAAVKALLVGLDNLGAELLPGWPFGVGDAAVKAGRVLSAKNETALRTALKELSDVLSLLGNDEPPSGVGVPVHA